jgi:hypothetical protein
MIREVVGALLFRISAIHSAFVNFISSKKLFLWSITGNFESDIRQDGGSLFRQRSMVYALNAL